MTQSASAPVPGGPTPRVIVAQVGARHNYAVARELHRHGCLAALYTDLCLPGWAAGAVRMPGMSSRLGSVLRRRTVRDIPAGHVRSAPGVTLWPQVCRLRGRIVSRDQDDRFGRAMRRWGFLDANVVYAMFGNGQAFLEAARARGIGVAIDIFITPVGHRIEAAERERYPDWHTGAPLGDEDIEAIERKVRQCIAVADLLVCPSHSVVEGLAAYGGEAVAKAALLPYANTARFRAPARPEPGRVLFAGAAEPRKGIHYLAFAAEALRGEGTRYRFVVAGGAGERVRSHPRARHLEFLGHLGREAMDREFLRADVFVLPTLAEGSASVVYEALAAGVPVVTTRSAGSVVTDGVEGCIVPERDSDAVARAVARIVEDRALRERMSAAARETAQRYSVERWGEGLVNLLAGVL